VIAARTRRAALAAALLAVLCAWAPGVHAELRALLVGVSGYPELPERLRLSGPRNDVQRMRQVLLARGFDPEQIETLADGVPGAALPTRANIMAALDRLATRSVRGDIVVLHFAGHGSQQPVDVAEVAESGGPALEQIFLPYDVKSWDREQRGVTNALRSRDLRTAADRITARGAFLWAIFDACHSARLVRGGEDEGVRYRHVSAAELGVPERALGLATNSPAATSTTRGKAMSAVVLSPTPDGAAAFFYATQTHEVTPEMPLPARRPGARVHGLFTHVVAKAMEQAQAMSYKQLAQFVLAEYRDLSEARATPLFAGTGLDHQVLGLAGERHLQWPLEEAGDALTVAAGDLSGIVAGAVFAILPSALAGPAQTEGHLRVVATQADRSELAPVGHAGQSAPARARLRAGQYLRLVSNPVDFDLRIAVDARSCPARCILADAVAQLRHSGIPGVAAVWVALEAGADIVLEQLGDRVVFVPAAARAGPASARARLAGVRISEAGKPSATVEVARRMATGLHAVARTRNLMRVSSRLMAQGTRTGLAATLQVQQGRSGVGQAEAVPAGATPSLRAGDRLMLNLHNAGATALDVTVLYLDADQGIVCLYPSRAGETNRLDPKGRAVVDIDIHAPPSGAEHILIIAAEVTRLGEQRNYAFLEQPPLDRQRGGAADLLDAFADAVFADHRARGAARATTPPARTTVQLFSIDVQP